MKHFTWSEAMSVGVPTLDADHRCLMRIINLLQDVEGEDAQRVAEIVLDTLIVYCRYHFAREERVMEDCNFPALVFHPESTRGSPAIFKACEIGRCIRTTGRWQENSWTT